jgi:hypothetical protein
MACAVPGGASSPTVRSGGAHAELGVHPLDEMAGVTDPGAQMLVQLTFEEALQQALLVVLEACLALGDVLAQVGDQLAQALRAALILDIVHDDAAGLAGVQADAGDEVALHLLLVAPELVLGPLDGLVERLAVARKLTRRRQDLAGVLEGGPHRPAARIADRSIQHEIEYADLTERSEVAGGVRALAIEALVVGPCGLECAAGLADTAGRVPQRLLA